MNSFEKPRLLCFLRKEDFDFSGLQSEAFICSMCVLKKILLAAAQEIDRGRQQGAWGGGPCCGLNERWCRWDRGDSGD